MNATERAALLDGARFYDELTAAADERTLEILERRRKTATIRRRGWLVRRMLLLADLLGLTVAFVATEFVFGTGSEAVDRVQPWTEFLLFVGTLLVWVVVAKIRGLYDRDEERTDHSTADDLAGVFGLVTAGAWLFYFGVSLTGTADPSLSKLVSFWALAIALVAIGRASARGLCRRSLTYLQNTVIVGGGDVGQLIARKFLQHPEYGINLVGFVDSAPKERREDLENLALLGPPERLPVVVRLLDVERVVIAFSNDSHEQTLDLMRSMKDLDVQVDLVPRLFEMVTPSVGIHTVEGIPLVGLPPPRLPSSSRLIKRSADFVLSALGLLLLSPAFAAVAVLIKLDSPGPVFFRQLRMGAGDKTFSLYKLRTMATDADERKPEFAHLNRHASADGDPRMFKITGDPRVTKPGRFLRRYFLDELPQLINVCKGEMSLVGPRPLILEEDQYVSEWARKRLDLKPGMTGVWQVAGRNAISFEEMVKLDYLYVTTWSLWNDCRILLRTIPLVLRGDGKGY